MQNNKRLFMKKLPLAAAVTAAVLATPALAVEFHGYARAGASTNLGSGGEQACFGSGAVGHFVGRLGDECDTYAEISLGDELYNQDGKIFRFNSMVHYATNDGILGRPNQGNDAQSFTRSGVGYSGGDIALRQLYLTGQNVIDALPGATLWAGKRYYQRLDVHQLDLYYLNNSGYGAGVENIQVGAGNLSVAYVNHDDDGDANLGENEAVQNNKIDVRYAFPVGGSTLTLAAVHAMADLTDAQEDAGVDDQDGQHYLAEIATGFMGGFNKFVVQYGADSMGFTAFENGGPGAVRNANSGLESSWRILNHGVIKLGGNWELGYSALYQQGSPYDNAQDDAERLSVVARPVYNWTPVSSTAIEIGYDDVQWNGVNAESNDLQKIAIAQQWQAGPGYWARPVIRLYAASFFGDQAKNAPYRGDVEGDINIGAQIEAWW